MGAHSRPYPHIRINFSTVSYSSTLNTKAANSSETMVTTHHYILRVCHISEESIFTIIALRTSNLLHIKLPSFYIFFIHSYNNLYLQPQM